MTGAALVRVPRAWGEGGEAMCEAAMMDIGLAEAATIAMSTLDEQVAALAAALPDVPVVLGGCCCAHIGAAAGLAGRHGRISVIWLDAHGDLNTPESSPSGNAWGMPFRRILDDNGAVGRRADTGAGRGSHRARAVRGESRQVEADHRRSPSRCGI